MQYLAAINPRGGIIEKFYTDNSEAEAFARAHDKSPAGVYDCVAELMPRAARHGRRMENVASIAQIHVDIDLKDLAATRDEVHGKVMALPAPFEVRDSGGGGYHIVQHLKDPAHAGTPALDSVADLRNRLTLVLAGDRSPNHNVALLRRVGTHNHKYGAPKLCQIIRPGIPVDLDEASTVIGSLSVDPWFGRGTRDPVLNPRRRVRADGEDDPFILLEEMSYRGAQPINRTQLIATKALMFDGVPLWRVTQIVLTATRDCTRGNPECVNWDWREEEEQIASMCYRAVNSYPKLYPALEPVHRVAWQTRLATEKTPRLVHTRNVGWVVDDTPGPPPKVADIDSWFCQVMDDTRLTGCALRHVYFNVLPAVRAEGYVQIRPAHAAQTIREPLRTVERAHSLLVARGHLCRTTGGGRIPRYVPALTAKNGGSGEISK